MKIAFFGASVTKQIDGFADAFASLQRKDDIRKFGFGGMHISGAGICFVDRVIAWHPDICFLDWFSTGYHGEDGEAVLYAQSIFNKLTDTGCRVIFLFLPFCDDPEKPGFYAVMKQWLARNGIEKIELDSILSDFGTEQLLKDAIHTTGQGARLYACELQRYLWEHPSPSTLRRLGKTKYENIRKIQVNRVFYNCLTFQGDCRILGFYQIVGPYSGLLENSCGERYQLWDRWCYYTRDHFTIALNVSGNEQLKILSDGFNTDACHQPVDFTKIRKKVAIYAIYYIGDCLKITNLKEGSRLNFWETKYLGLAARIRHLIWRHIPWKRGQR